MRLAADANALLSALIGGSLEERDPDDIELLALALHLRIPVWSNDDDFASARAPWLATAELLARLNI